MDSSGHPPILALNCGSSSVKFSLYRPEESLACVLNGKIEGVGLGIGRFTISALNPADGLSEQVRLPDHAVAARLLTDWLREYTGGGAVTAVGHRIVHGGPKYWQPQRITPEILAELHRLSPFDPEHMPQELTLVEALQRLFPDQPQIACFDTAFHQGLPRTARMLTIPRRYEAQGVHRYGFHGLSYAYLMLELERLAGSAVERERVVLAHLGNGASMAAVRDGRCVDTTMAFTPAAGLMMGSRSGDLDPGLLSFLTRSEGMSAARFDKMVNHESGLLGVSETSADMRQLLEAESTDVRAAEAIALFCYQAKKAAGAYAAALGGLNTLVFAAGIGENCALVRQRICAGLEFLGIELDESRNTLHAPVISTDASRVTVRVIRTDEELMIARSARAVLGLAPGQEN